MTDENRPERKRGGQPGNRNALKHGYYSRVFTREEIEDLRSAGDVRGLDEEIALVRHVIKKAAVSPDDRHMLIMIRAANVLNRLVRTRHKIEGNPDRLKEATERFRDYFSKILSLDDSPPPNDS
jgi:hypothetical protein